MNKSINSCCEEILEVTDRAIRRFMNWDKENQNANQIQNTMCCLITKHEIDGIKRSIYLADISTSNAAMQSLLENLDFYTADLHHIEHDRCPVTEAWYTRLMQTVHQVRMLNR